MNSTFYKALTFSLSFVACQGCEKFDREKWANVHVELRTGQAEALIREESLINLSLSEVEELLGEATIWVTANDTSSKIIKTAFYVTGKCQWIDYERLRIELVDDKVVEAKMDCW